MTEERNEELTLDEHRALRSLAGTGAPSRGLEARVVSALRERGLVRRASAWERALAAVPRRVRFVAALASLVAAFVAGTEYGKRSTGAPVPEVRLETPAAPETPAVEPAPAPSGAALAAFDDDPEAEERVIAGLEKPQLAVLDEGHGDFPPYPLDGKTRAISPKYR